MAEATPTRWYHWVLLYPALATTLLGSLPTAWQAFKAWSLDVAYAKVQQAEEQQRLWERNLDCLTVRPVYDIDIDAGVTLAVTLCPSGDVLLQYQRGAIRTYTWIPYPTAAARSAVDETQDRGPRPARLRFGTLRCAVVQPGLVLQLVQREEDQCALEYIQLASGHVVSRVTVPGTTRCAAL